MDYRDITDPEGPAAYAAGMALAAFVLFVVMMAVWYLSPHWSGAAASAALFAAKASVVIVCAAELLHAWLKRRCGWDRNVWGRPQ